MSDDIEKEKKKPVIRDIPKNIKNFFGLPDLDVKDCFIKVYYCKPKSARNRGAGSKEYLETYINTLVDEELVKEEFGPGHYEAILHIESKAVSCKTIRIAGDEPELNTIQKPTSDLNSLVETLAVLMPPVIALVTAIKGKKDPLDKMDALVGKVAESQIRNLDKMQSKMSAMIASSKAARQAPTPPVQESNIGGEIVRDVIATFKDFIPEFKKSKGIAKAGLMQHAKDTIDEDPQTQKVMQDPELLIQIYDGLIKDPSIEKEDVDAVLKGLNIEIDIDEEIEKKETQTA